jgi:PPOX class probable F420-dependent enzyme
VSDQNADWRARVSERLASDLILWFGSVRPDGRPHLVPVWFHWDGEAVVLFTKAGSQKVTNVRANPRVTLAVDNTDGGRDVAIVEGEAELLAEPSSAVVTPAYLEKYAAMIAGMGWSAEGMIADYPQPIRVRPTKVVTW